VFYFYRELKYQSSIKISKWTLIEMKVFIYGAFENVRYTASSIKKKTRLIDCTESVSFSGFEVDVEGSVGCLKCSMFVGI
jgi:hypothetical protein